MSYYVYGQPNLRDEWRQVRRCEKRADAVALVDHYVFEGGWWNAAVVTEGGRKTHVRDNFPRKVWCGERVIEVFKDRGMLRTRTKTGVQTIRPWSETIYEQALSRARLDDDTTILVALAPHEVNRLIMQGAHTR